jgi:hypothetical protein
VPLCAINLTLQENDLFLKLITMIENKLLLVMIILLATQNLLAQQNELNLNMKNESPLHIQPKDAPNQITDAIGSTYCSGILDTCLEELRQIGISKTRLSKKVQCAVGDFDGNGYLDFALWGIDTTRKFQYNIQWSDGKNYLVLFFEKSKIIRTIKIKTEPGNCLVNYPPREKRGPHGEPPSKNDALWIWGDTNGYFDTSKGTVYIFDLKSNNFKTLDFGK